MGYHLCGRGTAKAGFYQKMADIYARPVSCDSGLNTGKVYKIRKKMQRKDETMERGKGGCL